MLQSLKQPNQPFVLFQRDGTNWSMRYTMGGRQIRKSLGTSDKVEANRLANERARVDHAEEIATRDEQVAFTGSILWMTLRGLFLLALVPAAQDKLREQ
ncbi:hypothetical protein [Rhizobium sp.]|uniref:hypothetical protein n=1 Tax=Rhizobium sp. TaxID=391 RepID=UPI003F7EEB2F